MVSGTLIFLINFFVKEPKQFIFTILALTGSGISAMIALYVSYSSYFYQTIFVSNLFTWIDIADFTIEVGLKADALSSFMILFVAPVSFLIHIYATGYMDKDKSYGRFFIYFNYFIFFMFLLVLSDNPIMTYVGWEGVGLISYLLVAFYFKDIKNTYAGNKAFILNRIGDFGFLGAMMILFINIGSGGLSYDAIFLNLSSIDTTSLTLIAFLLFVAAMGKSAQIPLYVWLPDAMAGPTPVSALIHAATMVTAGVYMVARFAPLYNIAIDISLFISYIGAFSALLAAVIATRQYDIKKILAYSTMSQLGFMFMALGVGAYSTALFHTFTHAFFKGLLFMGAGAIIVAFHHKQDIRELRGIKKAVPSIFIMMLVGTLTISALPPLSAFISKDAIMSSLFASGHYDIFAIALLTSLLTVYYMFRMLFVLFYSNKSQKADHPSAKSMIIPMAILTVLSVVVGFLNLPEIFGGNANMTAWLGLPNKTHFVSHSDEIILMSVNTLLILAVIFYTYKKYAYTDTIMNEDETSVVANKFYIDEIYGKIIVKPLYSLSFFFSTTISKTLIDDMILGTAFNFKKVGKFFSALQNGNVRYYSLYMLLGVVIGFVYLFFLLKDIL
jgi:NADH-quinone oxidoreductase subunit L